MKARVRFVVSFLTLASLLLGAYYFPYGAGGVAHALEGFLHFYASVAGGVLGLFEPGLQVHGQEILGRYSLRIVKTCDAMDVTILLSSAILAWPAPWKRRLRALALAIPLVTALNVLRICSLYYVGIYLPSYFEVAHVEIWPAVILAVVVGGFVLFVRERSTEAAPSDASPIEPATAEPAASAR
jgi:exosortase/archaeosortase family protein